MGDVVNINCITRLPLNPQRVLEAALSRGLTSVVIIGFKEDGSEYFASSDPSGPEVLWLLERSKKRLLSMPDDGGFLEA